MTDMIVDSRCVLSGETVAPLDVRLVHQRSSSPNVEGVCSPTRSCKRCILPDQCILGCATKYPRVATARKGPRGIGRKLN